MSATSFPGRRAIPCASSPSRLRWSGRSSTGTSTERNSPTGPCVRSVPLPSPNGWTPAAFPPPAAESGLRVRSRRSWPTPPISARSAGAIAPPSSAWWTRRKQWEPMRSLIFVTGRRLSCRARQR